MPIVHCANKSLGCFSNAKARFIPRVSAFQRRKKMLCVVACKTAEEKFHQAYQAAFTMSQLYVKDRPTAVPISEHQRRKVEKDTKEIVEAARRGGQSESAVRTSLSQIDTLLPGLVSLDRLRASDWAKLAKDVNGVAEKIVVLKATFPNANVAYMMAQRPKMLMMGTGVLQENASKVRQMLGGASNPDAIVEAVPDLINPITLSHALNTLALTYPGQNPVDVLQRHPEMLLNSGEASTEADAEYGEMTTKD